MRVIVYVLRFRILCIRHFVINVINNIRISIYYDLFVICAVINCSFCCIYVWLDPGTYMISRFMSFYKPGVTRPHRRLPSAPHLRPFPSSTLIHLRSPSTSTRSSHSLQSSLCSRNSLRKASITWTPPITFKYISYCILIMYANKVFLATLYPLYISLGLHFG